MSLWSPDTLHVFCAPDAVLALSRLGWRGRLGETRRYAPNGSAGEPWQAPLAGIAAALKDFGCRRLRVVLSHHLVQFRVLPWRQDIGGAMEFRALAQLEFTNAFGVMADGWTIALSDEAPRRPMVAAAMPTALLEGLRTVSEQARARLLSVRPYLAAAANLADANEGDEVDKGEPRWLLIQEPGRLCAAARQDRQWRWVRHLRIDDDDWADQLPALLAAEALLAGIPAAPAKTRVFAPGAGRGVRAALRAQGLALITPVSERGFSADQDGAFAPAWLG